MPANSQTGSSPNSNQTQNSRSSPNSSQPGRPISPVLNISQRSPDQFSPSCRRSGRAAQQSSQQRFQSFKFNDKYRKSFSLHEQEEFQRAFAEFCPLGNNRISVNDAYVAIRSHGYHTLKIEYLNNIVKNSNINPNQYNPPGFNIDEFFEIIYVIISKEKEKMSIKNDENSLRYLSSAETRSFTERINHTFANDADLPIVNINLPILSDDLYSSLRNGVILCKLVNAAVPGTIDERVVNKGGLTVWQIRENAVLALHSAAAIGCRIVNVHPSDIENADVKPNLVAGVVWQIIRKQIFANLDVAHRPILKRLLKDDEDVHALKNLQAETLLCRWVNEHLEKSENPISKVKNFTSDFQDGNVYLSLLSQLKPRLVAQIIPQGWQNIEPIIRGQKILEICEKMGFETYMQAADIVNPSSKLTIQLLAGIFNNCPETDLMEDDMKDNNTCFNNTDISCDNNSNNITVSKDIIINDTTVSKDIIINEPEKSQKCKLRSVKNRSDDEAASLRADETAFVGWINSLNIGPVENIFNDLSDGIVFLQIIEMLAPPGSVDWMEVALNVRENENINIQPEQWTSEILTQIDTQIHTQNNQHEIIRTRRRASAIAAGYISSNKTKNAGLHLLKISNCNYAIKLAQYILKLQLVNISGIDLVRGDQKFILSFVWQLMRIHCIRLTGGLEVKDLVNWINAKLVESSGGQQFQISTTQGFSDPSLQTGIAFLQLIDCIRPQSVDWCVVHGLNAESLSLEEKRRNCEYLISLARRLGAMVFPLWSHIVNGRSKIIFTFAAAIYDAHLRGRFGNTEEICHNVTSIGTYTYPKKITDNLTVSEKITDNLTVSEKITDNLTVLTVSEKITDNLTVSQTCLSDDVSITGRDSNYIQRTPSENTAIPSGAKAWMKIRKSYKTG
eukprot:GHVL01013617.1.p1 GENE.GHVL01013617.1~~GHVL01013617.1.p1  ORF type:complete len:903 (+),score=230.80 GHVL01013617.1:42-2750(+)